MYDSVPTTGVSCLAVKGAIAYVSEVGLMANFLKVSQVEYSGMMFADNQRAITLRFSHESNDNTLIFKDSFISGVSRPTFPDFYGIEKISYCQGAEGVRMLAVSAAREFDIFRTPILSLDEITSQQSFDSKAFLNNVRFENFFSSNSNSSWPAFCSGMSVFRRNSGSHATASHYLTNTKCYNCEKRLGLLRTSFFCRQRTVWRNRL